MIPKGWNRFSEKIILNRKAMEAGMQFIYGLVVGAVLLLGSAYLHDTGMIGATDGKAPAPFVNWDTLTGMLGR
jgi:hypothetical protein